MNEARVSLDFFDLILDETEVLSGQLETSDEVLKLWKVLNLESDGE